MSRFNQGSQAPMSIIAEEIYSKNKAGHKRGEAGQREEGHHASSLKHWDKEAGGNLLRKSRKRGRARVGGGGVGHEGSLWRGPLPRSEEGCCLCICWDMWGSPRIQRGDGDRLESPTALSVRLSTLQNESTGTLLPPSKCNVNVSFYPKLGNVQ